MTNNKVTVIELSRRPMYTYVTYVVFEDADKAKEFLDDLSKCPHTFRVDKIRKNIDMPKFSYFNDEVFYNSSFAHVRALCRGW